MICSLSDLKQHLRVDGDEEDWLIQSYAQAAEEQVSHWIGRPIYRVADELPIEGSAAWHPAQIVATNAISVAVMMLAARLYEADRAAGGSALDPAVPPASVRALLAGHRFFAAEDEA